MSAVNADEATQFRAEACFDGWDCEKMNTHYPHYKAARLTWNGYRIEVVVLENLDQGSVQIWGPDGLRVLTPDKYDWPAIRAGMEHCNVCGRDKVLTTKYSFDKRCCEQCLPRQQELYEHPGWDK